MKMKTYLSWLLDSILIKTDGYGISKVYHHVIDATLEKYVPLNPLEYE